jgi:hypothetical protein
MSLLNLVRLHDAQREEPTTCSTPPPISSEGSSPHQELFHIRIRKLTKEELDQRMIFLWKLTFKKLIGAAIVLRQYKNQIKMVFLYGRKRREKEIRIIMEKKFQQ